MFVLYAATDPAKIGSRKVAKNPFGINREGKLVIDDDGEQGIAGSEKEQADEEMEIDLSNVCLLLSLIVHNCMIVMPFFYQTRKRKRPADDFEVFPLADGDRPETFTGGGGGGIHRKNPHKRDHDFDYGVEYRSKVSTLYICFVEVLLIQVYTCM